MCDFAGYINPDGVKVDGDILKAMLKSDLHQ